MAKKQTNEPEEKEAKKKCGIIMPIASHSDYHKSHWQDVQCILMEAIGKTEFEPSLVSDDPAIGLIHERIVTNIYNDDIVVCDVSSKNPNVMFELGLRLAFDKPTIIIKDEKNDYSFDIGGIEHIPYPSSLRHGEIEIFKNALVEKINATFIKSQEDNYSPFLQSFGRTIVPAKINETQISEGKFILEKLEQIDSEINKLHSLNNLNVNKQREGSHSTIFLTLSLDDEVLDFREVVNNITLNTDENIISIAQDHTSSSKKILGLEIKLFGSKLTARRLLQNIRRLGYTVDIFKFS